MRSSSENSALITFGHFPLFIFSQAAEAEEFMQRNMVDEKYIAHVIQCLMRSVSHH